jgi:hypothetical protein
MIPTTQMLAAVARDGPFLNDCARANETNTGYHALHDIRLINDAGSQKRYCGLHEAVAGHRDKWKGAESCAPLFARSMPSDREGENESDQ